MEKTLEVTFTTPIYSRKKPDPQGIQLRFAHSYILAEPRLEFQPPDSNFSGFSPAEFLLPCTLTNPCHDLLEYTCMQ